MLAFQCPREPTAQRATFYRHFESKNALVLAYFENRDQALWHYLSHPTPPKNLREALTKFEQMANWPEIIGCPFLRIASEYPDTAHPFHRLAIEHQNKILDYLTDLLKRCAIDKRAAAAILSVIDGAFSISNALWAFEGGSDSLARRGSTQKLSERAGSTQMLGCHYGSLIPSPSFNPGHGSMAPSAKFKALRDNPLWNLL